VVTGDPLQNLGALEHPQLVIHQGTIIREGSRTQGDSQ
jgi:hypothetical protein